MSVGPSGWKAIERPCTYVSLGVNHCLRPIIHEYWKCRKKDHRKTDCCSKAKEKDRKEDDKKVDGSVYVTV